MKIVKRLSDALVFYAFADDCPIVINDEHIAVGDPVHLYIGDMKQSNAEIIEHVAIPDDWSPGKYSFDGQAWALNPDWVEPASDGSANL